MRRIVVESTYTYETDLPVKVGDQVVLPTPDWIRDVKGDTWTAEVTALTSDHTGHCEKVLRILDQKVGSSQNPIAEAPEEP